MLNFESHPKEQFAQSLEPPSCLMVKTKARFKACEFGFPSDFDKWVGEASAPLSPSLLLKATTDALSTLASLFLTL